MKTGEGWCESCGRRGPFVWVYDEYGPVKRCADGCRFDSEDNGSEDNGNATDI